MNMKLELCPGGNMYSLAVLCLELELNAEAHPATNNVCLYSKGLLGLQFLLNVYFFVSLVDFL